MSSLYVETLAPRELPLGSIKPPQHGRAAAPPGGSWHPTDSNDGQKARGGYIYTMPRPGHQCMDDEDASEGLGSLGKHTQAWQKQCEENSK